MVFGKKVETDEFEAAMLPHLDELYRVAIRLVADRTEAEDLVQETYLQAWKSFHKFTIGTNCRAWLFKILLIKTKHRHRKRVKLKRESDDLPEGLAYEQPIPEDIADEEVLQALEKLPPYYKETLLLSDVQEMSYKEVAHALGIPTGTVMSRLHRGRKLLRAELAHLAESYGIKKA